MASCIIHYKGLFLEWSSITNAPSSFALARGEFERYYDVCYGSEGVKDLPEHLDRAVSSGSSAIPPMTALDVVSGNRAGPKESELTLDEIFARFYAGVERASPRP
ncbi:hypothetical protein [Bosea sp. Root381]|uniref:hypothetical protein n=1 Tax=Bosea sp. Root381 TaxID=1736524 RepID=UPI000A7403E0|nr:hypothetical protein [Bosea sp. Root381]